MRVLKKSSALTWSPMLCQKILRVVSYVTIHLCELRTGTVQQFSRKDLECRLIVDVVPER